MLVKVIPYILYYTFSEEECTFWKLFALPLPLSQTPFNMLNRIFLVRYSQSLRLTVR